MRLKPPISADEAFRHLARAAIDSWGAAEATRLEGHLRGIADAMAIVGALDIPDEVEPLFGEDIGLDEEASS